MNTERQKMDAGEWYRSVDPELDRLRDIARAAVHQHNTMPPATRGQIGPALAVLIGVERTDVFIEAPFHVAYGINLDLGRGVYINAGCAILDTARVRIGDHSMLGPNVQIYCAAHHLDMDKRGLEVAKPVEIGERVWIGGAAILLPGVTVGDGANIGAGSVVTRDVAPGATVAGNPARPI